MMPNVYRKTGKGNLEVAYRSHGLQPRQRQALILVDGKRDVTALRALLPAADTLIPELSAAGFIELAPDNAPPPRGIVANPPAPRAGGADFDNLKRNAVQALHEAVGPAGEALAIRIERCGNVAELRPLLAAASLLIAELRGRVAAEIYTARFPSR